MEYTSEFETFWKKYPARWNSNLSVMVKRKKYPAFVSWQKLTPETQRECLFKAKYIKQTEGTPRDCVTWLNQRGWDDIELEVPKAFMPKEFDTANVIKIVPEGDRNSTSNKVNQAKNALNIKGGRSAKAKEKYK